MPDKRDDVVRIERMDVRILTLKRWNHYYQSQPICPSDSRRGDYVSFQNYHYVDVSEVKWEEGEDVLAAAYTACQAARTNNVLAARGQEQEVYIQQSMLLLGWKSDFWETTPKVLFITMLQLSYQKEIEFKKIKERIAELFEWQKIEPKNWALYYSLDFCDLILLARDMPLKNYQDILWLLSPIRDTKALKWVRDTITVYSVEYEYLRGKFEDFAHSVVPQAASDSKVERFSLIVSLSVLSYGAWSALKKQLDGIGVEITHSRVLGRYDLQVVVRGVTFEQALYVVYLIDSYCEANSSNFGGYELVPLVEPCDSKAAGVLAEREQSFEKAARVALQKLYVDYNQALNNANQQTWGYAAEIRRSLCALLINGFSEEFVLSVFHSFAEYLLFVTNKMAYANAQSEELYRFQREYFQAISMLMHCTMHSERQFIQAPAFNVTLCDVPPKLLAFYASIAYYVTGRLHDENNRTFSFLIAPDFRPDIYVKPISYGAADENKISIIYLNEKLFYDPHVVVPIMCHEIAHYVGNESRHRCRRMELIFDAVCAFLLYNVMPLDEKGTGETPPLLAPLAEAFGSMLKDAYYAAPKSEFSEYCYVNDIDQFLIKSNMVMVLAASPLFQAKLKQVWTDVLMDPNRDISQLLNKLGTTLKSPYPALLYNNGAQKYYSDADACRKAACNIMAGNMVVTLQKFFTLWKRYIDTEQLGKPPSPIKMYFEFCQMLIQACSEAYSDLRMIELLGIRKASQYENILNKSTRYRSKGRKDLQLSLRHDVVCEACDLENWSPLSPQWNSDAQGGDDQTMRVTTKYAQGALVKYLRECINKQDHAAGTSDQYANLNEMMEQLKVDDPKKIFDTIRSAIIFYRNKLTEYCIEVSQQQAAYGEPAHG